MPDYQVILKDTKTFILFSIVYPVLEEFVFRGIIQEYLKLKLKRTSLGPITCQNLITSLLFVILHFINHSMGWAIAVFIPSIVFGYFKDKYNNLFPPIFLHCFYNAGYFIVR